MSWVPSRSPKDANRRFRKAVLLWNGTLAIVWVVLAMWRIEQTMPIRFAAVAFFGLLNLVIISRVVLPGKHAE